MENNHCHYLAVTVDTISKSFMYGAQIYEVAQQTGHKCTKKWGFFSFI